MKVNSLTPVLLNLLESLLLELGPDMAFCSMLEWSVIGLRT